MTTRRQCGRRPPGGASLALLTLLFASVALVACGEERRAGSPSTDPSGTDHAPLSGVTPEEVPESPEAAATFEVIRFVPCDVATWFLYDPADLAHRRTAPELWWMHEFALQPELAAARLVVVGTGSDGNFGVRFTDGGLSARERRWARAPSATFPLRVSRGRLFLGNGDALPCEDPIADPDDDPEGWIDVPTGDYAVTVHRIAWADEPGSVDQDGISTDSALTAFVATFERVEDLAQVAPLSFIPRLDGGAVDADREEPSAAVQPGDVDGEFVVCISDAAVFPGVDVELEIASDVAGIAMEEGDWQVLVAPQAEPGTLAVLFRFSTVDEGETETVAVGSATQFVRIAAVETRDGTSWGRLTWARVTRLEEQAVAVAPARLVALQAAFANYAETNAEYRERMRYPRFAAERIAAERDPTAIVYGIAALLELADAERTALIEAPDLPGRLAVVEAALAERGAGGK